MRPIITLPLSTLLACGPLAPPIEAASTSTSETSETTDTPTPTTTAPSATNPVTPTTITDPTTIDITTFGSTSTGTGINTDSFIITPDGGTMGTIHCDPFKQDCPPGQKCAPWAQGGGGAWNALKCVDVIGDGAPGEPCTAQGSGVSGIDDCAFGAYCWDVDENLHGTCIAQCTGTADAPMCPPKFSCWITGEGILNLCIPHCDPLFQDCPGDDLCIPNGDTFLCVHDASGEEGQFNDPCEFANSCDKGLLCLNTTSASSACDQDSTGCCQPFCEFPDAPCPNPDQQCLQWYDPMMPIPEGYENVGICAIPE